MDNPLYYFLALILEAVFSFLSPEIFLLLTFISNNVADIIQFRPW